MLTLLIGFAEHSLRPNAISFHLAAAQFCWKAARSASLSTLHAKQLSQRASAIIKCLAQALRSLFEIIKQLANGLAQPAYNYFSLCQKTFLVFQIISELLAHPVWN